LVIVLPMDNQNKDPQNDLTSVPNDITVPENDLTTTETPPVLENDLEDTSLPLDETKTQDEVTNPLNTGTDQASDFLNLDGLIKRCVAGIDRVKQDLKIQKDMLDSAFLNDPVYQEHDKAVKEATKVRSRTKQAITKQQNVAQIVEKINVLKDQMKELQQSLSQSLQQYQKLSGATQIELEDGSVMEIVSTVKLVKKSSEFRP